MIEEEKKIEKKNKNYASLCPSKGQDFELTCKATHTMCTDQKGQNQGDREGGRDLRGTLFLIHLRLSFALPHVPTVFLFLISLIKGDIFTFYFSCWKVDKRLRYLF